MKKVISYAIVYAMWIANLLLAFWFAMISRDDILGIFALFYKKGDLAYSHRVDFFDKAYTLVLGLGWLAFMIITEEYFRASAQRGNLLKRFARLTGPVLLFVFVADLILFWLQGIGGGNWLRWSLLAGELGFGIGLLLYAKSPQAARPS